MKEGHTQGPRKKDSGQLDGEPGHSCCSEEAGILRGFLISAQDKSPRELRQRELAYRWECRNQALEFKNFKN